ncbi:MAG: hypothetical protein IJ561_00750 [Ruminococcus sp.]|nr:hypothetical protein [Ruminococcus sp.]
MVKRNVLTPVLSGVLAVTVAGSGALYVLDKKDGNDSTDEKNKSEQSTLERVADRVEATADLVEKAIKGELDFSYNSKVELQFGKYLTDQLGAELKPISLEAKTKQKAGKSEADIIAAYDSNALATLNIVVDNEAGVLYVKVPELSDGYLTTTADDMQKIIDSYTQSMQQSYNQALAEADVDMDELQKMLEEIDIDAIFTDLEEYVQTVKDAIPEGTENGTLDGDINGYGYSYTVKTLDVTGQVVIDIANSVVDKAKNDTLLKDYAAKAGVSEADYNKMIDEMSTQFKNVDESQASQKFFSVDVYYLDDTPYGFGLDMGEQGVIKMVAIDDGSVIGIDLAADMRGESMSVKGAFENKNDTINGSITATMTAEGQEQFRGVLTADNVTEQGELFSGTVKAEVTADGKTGSLTLASNSTEDKVDVKLSVDFDGNNIVTVAVTGESTDASDITVPTGTAYKLDEEGLKAYMEACDTDKFLQHVQDTLGTELTEKLMNNRGYDDDDDYDYNYDDDDYDYSYDDDDYDYSYDDDDYNYDDFDLDDFNWDDFDFGDYEF